MRWLIVNADDLGLTPGVNAGILEGHRRGIVTSASLMANLPGAAEAAALARKTPGLGVGLHLNLSAGQPLTGCPALTWADGSFLSPFRVQLRVALSPRARQEAWAEMEAQAEEARRLGVPLDHLDSHHHLHLFPPLLRRAVALARELGVPLRLPGEQLTAGDWVRDWGAALASRLAARARRRPGMPQSATHTLGLRLHRAGFQGETLARVLTAIPEGTTEFICHPGYADEELSHLSRYSRPREGELAALTDPLVKAALEEAGVRLINWQQLSTGA